MINIRKNQKKQTIQNHFVDLKKIKIKKRRESTKQFDAFSQTTKRC